MYDQDRLRNDMIFYGLFGPSYFQIMALGALGFLILFVGVGLGTRYIQDSRLAAVQAAFHAKPDFLAITVHEEEPAVNDSLLQAIVPFIDRTKPVMDSLDTTQPRKYYAVPPNIKVGDLPTPRYVQVCKVEEREVLSPLYSVFKGPGAFDKLEQWLRKNGYDSTDYQFKFTRTNDYETEPFRPSKPGSQVVIVGWFTVGWRTYAWDGNTVLDYSEGITGHVGKMQDEYTPLWIETLQRIGQ